MLAILLDFFRVPMTEDKTKLTYADQVLASARTANKPTAVTDFFRGFTSIEKSVLHVLYNHLSALSVREIRTRLIMSAFHAVMTVSIKERIKAVELKERLEQVNPKRGEKIKKTIISHVIADKDPLLFFGDLGNHQSVELFAEQYLQIIATRKVPKPEEIEKLLKKTGAAKIPVHETVENTIESLVSFGFVLKRPPLNGTNAKALYFLAPSTVEFLNEHGYQIPSAAELVSFR